MFALTAGALAPSPRTVSSPVGVTAEFASIDAAAGAEAAWRDLAARSLEPNVFYAPATALAALRHLPEGRRTEVLMAWRLGDEPERRRLVGLLPLVAEAGRYLLPLPVRRAAEVYGTLSTPLLDPDRPVETLTAMFRALDGRGIRGVLFPFAHEDGPFDRALAEVCATTGRRRVRLHGHRRAMLRSPLPGADYMRATLETRRRKEADRQRRRLAELGALTFRVARTPSEVGPALEEFLDLEERGWKGRRGTDMKNAPGAGPFIREAERGLSRDGAIRVASLRLDDHPVAAGIVLTAGRRAFYNKTAYDETLSRFSPGFLLTLDLTAHLLDDPEIDDADSIAVADHPMIDRLWLERFPVASVLASTRPGGGVLFHAAVGAERLREDIRRKTLSWRDRLKASRQSSGNDSGGKPSSSVSG